MFQRVAIVRALCILSALSAASFASAEARTAVYVSPALIGAGPLKALSTKGDKAGYTVGLNQTLGLFYGQNRFGAIKNADKITIFTLAPAKGDSRALISIGVWNNGKPIIVKTQNVNGGNTFSISNLFQQGCSVFHGCNYIAITTDRARNGAAGMTVDFVDINGEVTEVAAPTPEPSIWMLMILGFVGVAGRLKSLRPSDCRWATRTTGHSGESRKPGFTPALASQGPRPSSG